MIEFIALVGVFVFGYWVRGKLIGPERHAVYGSGSERRGIVFRVMRDSAVVEVDGGVFAFTPISSPLGWKVRILDKNQQEVAEVVTSEEDAFGVIVLTEEEKRRNIARGAMQRILGTTSEL